MCSFWLNPNEKPQSAADGLHAAAFLRPFCGSGGPVISGQGLTSFARGRRFAPYGGKKITPVRHNPCLFKSLKELRESFFHERRSLYA